MFILFHFDSAAFFYVFQVTQQGKETWIILSQRLKMKAFAYNVRMLLETQADGVIAVGKFVSSYSKYFSQDCKMATFGFSKLHDLIEAVPNVAKVCWQLVPTFGCPHAVMFEF